MNASFRVSFNQYAFGITWWNGTWWNVPGGRWIYSGIGGYNPTTLVFLFLGPLYITFNYRYDNE